MSHTAGSSGGGAVRLGDTGDGPVGGADDRDARPSVGELFSHVTEDISTLMRQEVALAKAEATTSAKKAGKGAGLLAGAAVAGFLVLVFLSVAAWWGLGTAMGNRGWSGLIVAAVWAIIAGVLAAVGRTALTQISGLPQTAETVKQAPNALKGKEELNR